MLLSAPIYVLKRQAKQLSRQRAIPLHDALDQVAQQDGFKSWSHLASSSDRPAMKILSQLEPGQLILLGARPGQGKTLLGLELASKAKALGRKGYFFTLDYHERDIADRMQALGLSEVQEALCVDTSDDVSADYVISRVQQARRPTLIVVDYLQLLDQKRSNPSLNDQAHALRDYARTAGAICILISQIDRSFDLSGKPMPDRSDIRLPNPLDLTLFDRILFLHQGKLQIDHAA